MSLSASLLKIDDKYFFKGEHQAALVYLGQLAFSETTAAHFAIQAATAVTQVLQVKYSLFWERREDSQGLILLAAQGIADSPSTSSFISLQPNSLEAITLSSPGPVIAEKSKNDFELSYISSIAAQSVENGVSVRIGTLRKPDGILQVFSADGRFFSQNDIYFLQNVANLVGLVMHREQYPQEQSAISGIRVIKTESAIQSRVLEWDRSEIKNRLVESQERERLHLAQDLHDAPIQDLYGMIYQLDDLRDAVADSEEEKILDECNHTLHRVVNSLRTICRELRPPSLSPFGLEVAIRDHVEKFCEQNPEIQVHLDLMQDRQALSDRMRLTLFRIYQQAIHNVARHSQASDAHIRFRWDEKMMVLEVEDNGIGFEVPENWVDLVRDEHFGLLGIAERIESIRGKLEIVSTVGNGTLIRVIAPYPGNEIG